MTSIQMMMYHKPVLLKESIAGLAIEKGGIYVDTTFGGGGHSKEIIKNLKNGKLFGFDQDEDALDNVIDDNRFIFIDHNFKFLKNFLRFHNAIPCDGILADLGVSSHQFDKAERGFSIRFEGELDMRMNKRADITAKEVLNNYAKDDLKRIFYRYGEIKNANKLATAIVENREKNKINTTTTLVEIAKKCAKKGQENKYLAQIFQAVRIEVNEELEILEEMLLQSLDVLKPGGRLVVITYHSLEDRIVKNFLKCGNFEGKVEKDFYGNVLTPFKLINRKPIIPESKEIEENSRARSAKLRIAEKI